MGKPCRAGLAEFLGMKPLSFESSTCERVLVAEPSSLSQPWRVKPAPGFAEDGIEKKDSLDDVTHVALGLADAKDSLGFPWRLRCVQDLRLWHVHQTLCGLCAAGLLWHDWLPPGSPWRALSGQPMWVAGILQTLQSSRTLSVMIFPLLGFADRRASIDGEVPVGRIWFVLGIYIAMGIPRILGEEVMTFHRWPLWVWLWSLIIVRYSGALKVPGWAQTALALGLAPSLAHTPDALHTALGGQERPHAWSDPSLLLLEHRFFHSVGDKFYFTGCYLIGYHYLSGAGAERWLACAIRLRWPARLAAALAFVGLTFTWEAVGKPLALRAPEDMAEWPEFLGHAYPFMALADWTAMALLVITCGEGFALLRQMGCYMLGTMVCHMYIQLPLPAVLQGAAMLGKPAITLLVAALVPVAYVMSVGRLFQTVLLLPASLASRASHLRARWIGPTGMTGIFAETLAAAERKECKEGKV